ncbi:hypothetical protein LA080_007670 [Diaporthe eres]|nr:hypothetical protein LA080_007670 [Diaporthe eres]
MADMHTAANESGDGDGDDGETETETETGAGTDWWVGRCFSQTARQTDCPGYQTKTKTKLDPEVRLCALAHYVTRSGLVCAFLTLVVYPICMAFPMVPYIIRIHMQRLLFGGVSSSVTERGK